MKTQIKTDKAPDPGATPFSQAIEANGFVFTQGCVYLTMEGKLLEGTDEELVHQTMKNLQNILEAAGATFDNVVKTTIYLTDMSLGPTVNKVYSSYLKEPFPAREMICVKELPLGAKIEISMVAVKS
jgi:2-iminobutanoate/2-iminopropanoate deaminase